MNGYFLSSDRAATRVRTLTRAAVLVLALIVFFRAALNIAPPTLRVEDVAHPACKAALLGFRINIRRVIRLLGIPGYSGWFALVWDDLCNNSADELLGEKWTMEQFNERRHEIFSMAAWKIGERTAAWDANEQRIYDVFVNNLQMTGFSPPNEYPSKDDRIGRPLTALLESAVIQAWGAHELLCRTLWEAAASSGSSCLIIPTHFGIGKYKTKIGFASRNKTKGTYLALFKFDYAEIETSLIGDAVDAPAIIRNVLVHHGGIIDDDFLTDSSAVSQLSALRALGKGAQISVDGTLALQLINPLIPKGCELVVSVDNWLKAHP